MNLTGGHDEATYLPEAGGEGRSGLQGVRRKQAGDIRTNSCQVLATKVLWRQLTGEQELAV